MLLRTLVLLVIHSVHAWPDITTPKDNTDLLQNLTKLMPMENRGHDKYGYFIPDGHIWSLPHYENGHKTDKWIVHTTYDWSFLSTSPRLADAYANWSGNASDYDDSQVYHHGTAGNNFVTLQPGISFAGPTPMPSLSEAGFRDPTNYSCAPYGCWDSTSYWLNNAYRVSETSGPGNNTNFMIGFAHNEDHWYPPSKKYEYREYKHVGVRYSNDGGKSWTRSVPILIRGREEEGGTGCGDMAVIWNHRLKVWQAYMQEYVGEPGPNGLIIAFSNDTYARPGTWTRIQPNASAPSSWTRDIAYSLNYGPETILKNTNLTRDNGRRCTNPSIIFDERSQYWHMVCHNWDGGLRYSNSTDGWNWRVPVDLTFSGNVAKYASLIGTGGDRITSDGSATLYYWNTTDSHSWDVVRKMYSVEWKFPSSAVSSLASVHGVSPEQQNILKQAEL